MTTLQDILPNLGRHAGDLEVSKYFMAWPGKEKGHVLHEVETMLSVDQALHALFGQDAPIGVKHHCDGTLYSSVDSQHWTYSGFADISEKEEHCHIHQASVSCTHGPPSSVWPIVFQASIHRQNHFGEVAGGLQHDDDYTAFSGAGADSWG